MKISRKEEDFRIYVENDIGQYILSKDVLESEKTFDKRIDFKISLNKQLVFTLSLTREEIKNLSELLTETIKYL